jgi:hypothetical protein
VARCCDVPQRRVDTRATVLCPILKTEGAKPERSLDLHPANQAVAIAPSPSVDVLLSSRPHSRFA